MAEVVPDETQLIDATEEDDEAQHPLSEFFTRWEGKSGLYFISPYFDEDRPDERYPVKVGMSRHRSGRADDPDARHRGPYGGLGRRLDSYLLCYVRGFYIYSILQCHRDKVYRMEKFFHQYFTGKGLQMPQQHSHREEWFSLSKSDVFSTINAYRRNYPDDIVDYLVFTDPPQFIDTNGRLAAHTKKNMNPEEKLLLEQFMSPDKVPQTLKRKKGRVTNLDDDEEAENEVPAFSLQDA